MIFSFTSSHIIAAVLLQKKFEGHEQPIALFSQVLREAKLKYDTLEKKAYALLKSLKSFQVYVL